MLYLECGLCVMFFGRLESYKNTATITMHFSYYGFRRMHSKNQIKTGPCVCMLLSVVCD